MDYKWEAIKYTIVRRTIETICDLICTFPKSTTFVPNDKSDNWLESLVGFYIFGTIASDWHLIVDSEVWINISNALRVMLDGYTKDLWQTTFHNDAQSKAKSQKANTDSVSCDIMEAFMIIGRTDDAANLQPWSSDEVHQAINGDHHDNMFRRLQVRFFLKKLLENLTNLTNLDFFFSCYLRRGVAISYARCSLVSIYKSFLA